MRVACIWLRSEYPIQKLAEVCLRLSPQLSVRGDEALFIEIGKCHRLYSESGFLARLQVILRKLQIQAYVAVDDTIAKALVRAKYNTSYLSSLPLEALSDLADPFNKDLVLRKYIQKMIVSFKDLGVNNLGEFHRIPIRELIARFGAAAAICAERLRSSDATPWPLWKPEDVITEKSQFPYFEFYGELEPILFELKRHLDSIFVRLWGRQRKLQALQVYLFCEKTSRTPFPERKFHFDFFIPQSSTKACLAIIQEKLTREFQKHPLRTPLEAIESKVLVHVPGEMGQKSLLHNREEQEEKLAGLLGHLMEAHGKDNIYQAELTEDRRPEKSWKKVRYSQLDKENQSEKNSILHKIPLRPSCLIHPEPVHIADDCLYIRNKAYRISEWLEDIERISGDWVDGASYDRTYLIAVLENGPKVSIYQTPDKGFFLHGYFA